MNLGQGKHFSITDPKDVKTVIYQINPTVNPEVNSPKFTLQRLESRSQLVGENTKKTFFVDDVRDSGNPLVILSFAKDKVIVNMGKLNDNVVKISKKPHPVQFNTLYSDKETEIKDVKYTPNLQRPITIIDPETAEEVKPILYIDKDTNEVKGKCKLKPYKSYFTFEIRDKKI